MLTQAQFIERFTAK